MRIIASCGIAALILAGCGDKGDSKTVEGPLDKLKIDDVVVGTGPAAKTGDILFMTYSGKLANGTVFDSTDKHGGDPFSLTLGANQVIQGWEQGLLGIKEGGQRKLSIPAKLGYGAQGQGEIPANSDLFFDVKLVKRIDKEDRDVIGVKPVKEGTGPELKDGDTAYVKYKGTLIGGKMFDTNDKPGGTPLEVVKGGGSVVPGFDAGLGGMKKGGERIVTIPPQYGYGPQAQGPIPANSWLVFDITVVDIKPGKAKK